MYLQLENSLVIILQNHATLQRLWVTKLEWLMLFEKWTVLDQVLNLWICSFFRCSDKFVWCLFSHILFSCQNCTRKKLWSQWQLLKHLQWLLLEWSDMWRLPMVFVHWRRSGLVSSVMSVSVGSTKIGTDAKRKPLPNIKNDTKNKNRKR